MILLFGLSCLFLISGVSADCQSTSISEISQVLENQTGLLWDVTIDINTNWTYSPVTINSRNISGNHAIQESIKHYFSLSIDTNRSALTFSVVRELDKESHFWVNASNGELSSIGIQVHCSRASEVPTVHNVRVVVGSVNEFRQHFNSSFPDRIEVFENVTRDSIVFKIHPYIVDADIPKPTVTDFAYTLAAVNGQVSKVTFNVVCVDSEDKYKLEWRLSTDDNDGTQWFQIPITSSDHIKVHQTPDFDELIKTNKQVLAVMIIVKANDNSGFSTNRTLEIEIKDVDDLPPSFQYPGCYNNCTVTPFEVVTGSAYRGSLTNIQPVSISAKDQDSLNSTIQYSIQPLPNSFHTSFTINQHTAEIQQIGDVTVTGVLTIMATEDTPNRFYKTATLLVKLSNDTAFSAQSKSPEQNDNFKIIAIIVGAISLVAIATLIFLLIFVYKRMKKKAIVAPESKSPRTLSEHLVSEKPPSIQEKVGNWQQTMNPQDWPTVNNRRPQLDPLTFRDETTETDASSIKKKRPRKKKKKLMEIFDGTKKFEDKADPEFFQDPDKTKIKRSTRSKNKQSGNAPLVVSSD